MFQVSFSAESKSSSFPLKNVFGIGRSDSVAIKNLYRKPVLAPIFSNVSL